MNDNLTYLNYLKRRSILGKLYRQYWLYPRLARQISGRVLDIGCGIGDFVRYRANTIGVDVNVDIVNWCIDSGLNVKHMEIDLLGFPDASFDAVVLDNVLEHIASPEKLLAEIKRVLIPGAVFLLGVPGIRGYKADPDHKVFYDQALLIRTMENAGFIKGKIFLMPLNLPFLNKFMSQFCIYGVFRK
ncbi:MAG: SAM-dependent methyltransferase [Enterobacterales bacterium]|jgi:SAM-dependent methyltransferase